MNVLYIVPNLHKVSGGPRTRVSLMGHVFRGKGDQVISEKQKFSKSLRIKGIDVLYVESATNRISWIDLCCLLLLKFRSKKTIVFIRDVYIELFPEEFSGLRSRVTKIFNKASNCFLSWVSDKMAFPTKDMGTVFYEKNTWFPKRPYVELPPGCQVSEKRKPPDLSKKIGIVYLGGVSYTNAGFEHFLGFAENFKNKYRFFVLSGDGQARKMIDERRYISLDTMERSEIPAFIESNNICIAFHSRPRNPYDDITFPIKALDFISFQLPFLTEPHPPLRRLLGPTYDLFVDISNYRQSHFKIQRLINDEVAYKRKMDNMWDIARQNTYEIRYEQIVQL